MECGSSDSEDESMPGFDCEEALTGARHIENVIQLLLKSNNQIGKRLTFIADLQDFEYVEGFELMNVAQKLGNLKAVKYLHEVVGIGFHRLSVVNASRHGHLDVVIYLVEKGAFFDSRSAHVAIKRNFTNTASYLIWQGAGVQRDDVINVLCRTGNLKLLKLVHRFRGRVMEHHMSRAIHFGHVHIAKFLYSVGCRPEESDVTWELCAKRLEGERNKFSRSIGNKLTRDYL